MIKATHEAVMVDEVLENLVFKQNGKYVDCTFGAGGHSHEILKKIDRTGFLTSIEKFIFCKTERVAYLGIKKQNPNPFFSNGTVLVIFDSKNL